MKPLPDDSQQTPPDPALVESTMNDTLPVPLGLAEGGSKLADTLNESCALYHDHQRIWDIFMSDKFIWSSKYPLEDAEPGINMFLLRYYNRELLKARKFISSQLEDYEKPPLNLRNEQLQVYKTWWQAASLAFYQTESQLKKLLCTLFNKYSEDTYDQRSVFRSSTLLSKLDTGMLSYTQWMEECPSDQPRFRRLWCLIGIIVKAYTTYWQKYFEFKYPPYSYVPFCLRRKE